MEQAHDPALLEILDQAARLPEAERASFLDQACRDNAQLRAQVQSLLSALDRGANFLANPTIGEHAAAFHTLHHAEVIDAEHTCGSVA